MTPEIGGAARQIETRCGRQQRNKRLYQSATRREQPVDPVKMRNLSKSARLGYAT
jgi:hypothetical protein